MGLAVNAGISIWNEESSACLSSIEMLIPALTASLFMEISFTIGFENGQNRKLIFEKNA